MDDSLEFLNRATASLEWRTLRNASAVPLDVHASVFQLRLKWRNRWCAELIDLQDNGMFVDRRLRRFLCRGPKYTGKMTREIAVVKESLSSTYDSARICKSEGQQRGCYQGESEVAKLMATSRNERELRWAWSAWRDRMSGMRWPFAQLVALENAAARSNGYADVGAYWREEFEIPNLENVFEEMYRRVEPLYRLLHAVVRSRLAKLYPDVVDTSQPIPAHLLGNLWSQSWETLIDVVFPNYAAIVPDLADSMRRDNYSVTRMVREAEDFYVSLGFPPLTPEFWRNSVLEREPGETTSCHATAVNMFKRNDVRIFACLEARPQDINVIHHELGHIQYYMAYQNQPSFFKNGVNSAFHEAIGDAISHGATSARHMRRLGLMRGASPNSLGETAILVRRALLKIPQLLSGLVIEKWRWSVFSGRTRPSSYNRAWWELHRRYMGVAPPSPRTEQFFDAAAKYHVAHGIPYARYYLASFLQVQLFGGMCEATGSTTSNASLHECDIYGSKDAGRILSFNYTSQGVARSGKKKYNSKKYARFSSLRSVMKLGSSVDWRRALRFTTGRAEYRAEPLLAYYEPVREWLQLEIKRRGIPMGWN
ncbi:PREDICTED: angiotensin-converting enzyme-like [Dinoponera quadriceps]|uniref:Angiotensin-converting enzyme n=1 Tax=Dinoponera quadriceps TaxID=609295 RepID=A0A6P3X1E5_DINQU|nr:PREDICTED: angiotensin-converting enzyme-like [Dinoponera quadriceps]